MKFFICLITVLLIISPAKMSEEMNKPANYSKESDDSDAITKMENFEEKASPKIVIEGTDTYQLVKGAQKHLGVEIFYPQISGLADLARQEKINKLIKDRALEIIMNIYYNDYTDLKLDIDYEISLKSDDILSIKFIGGAYRKGSNHPNSHFYTANIDIKNGKLLKLSDLINLNDDFANLIREKDFTFVMYESPEKKETFHFNNYIGFEYLTDYDVSVTNNCSYLTKDSLGISVGTIYALGSHKEFEIKYDDISDEMWKLKPW